MCTSAMRKIIQLDLSVKTSLSYVLRPLKCSTKSIEIKAMRKPENSVIMCSAEIDLNGITTVRNLTEINCTSETPGNYAEILTEMLNRNGTGNKYKISGITGITGNNPEILKKNQKPRKFRSKYVNYGFHISDVRSYMQCCVYDGCCVYEEI